MDNKKDLILIVDDNLKNLEVLTKILKEEGFLISLAQDGGEALDQLNNITPDLILLDIMMPEMNGLEVCRRIKQNDKLKEIPVIFVTAKNQTEDLVEGFKAGGVDYISKPFQRDELLVRIKNHLELTGSRKRIIALNRTRDKIYSIIAHDIRSPFSSIRLLLNLISSDAINPGSEEFKEIMNMLEKITDSSAILLNNLLEWTKNQSGAISLSPKTLKIRPLLLECAELLKGNAEHKNITIHVNVSDDAEAFFDEITMHTVFRNLISNAIKFTPEHGAISLRSEPSGDHLIVYVEDNGVGMSEDVIRKIFEKNEHYTSLGTGNEKGTGFGLVMIKEFVEQNRGKLQVRSAEGKGTTFSVFIPRAPL